MSITNEIKEGRIEEVRGATGESGWTLCFQYGLFKVDKDGNKAKAYRFHWHHK